jgi:hypothetical protein
VRNKNTEKRIQVTVSCTESNPFQTPSVRRLNDQVILLAPGQRVFIGGTKSGNSSYTYGVAGAAYQ